MSDIAARNDVEVIMNPYVKDGLVFWIDAVWNVGIGKHEDNVIPYDLMRCGAYESGSCEFGKDFIHIKMGQYPLVYRCDDIMKMFPTNDSGIGTLEVVFEATYANASSQYQGDVGIGDKNGFAYFNTQAMQIQAQKYSDGIKRATGTDGLASGYHIYSASVFFDSNQVGSICFNGKYGTLSRVGYANNMQVTPYIKIGCTTGSTIDRKFYCVRLYDRKLSEEETITNWIADKERFNI